MDINSSKEGQLSAFHHVKFWVSNARQTANWYCIHYGFKPFAFRQKDAMVSYVVKSNKIVLIFETNFTNNNEFLQHVIKEGDSVKDVSFEVDNLSFVLRVAKSRGAQVEREIWVEEDENGLVQFAVIRAYGNVVHTLIETKNYNGFFLPGYKTSDIGTSLLDKLPQTKLEFIDHVVGAQKLFEVANAVKWYEEVLDMHRFWSVDDQEVHTEYSGLRVTVVSNDSGTVKLPIVEPATGSKRAKSQIQEYLDYNGGPGIQHIAFSTDDIVSSVGSLVQRGAEFIRAPKTYYNELRNRLKSSPIDVKEDLDELERLNILLDYDENGYLLQIFTRPVQDKPTLFLEIIQRHNHEGFGAGNIKALFEAVEIEQKQRGNLLDSRGDGHAHG